MFTFRVSNFPGRNSLGLFEAAVCAGIVCRDFYAFPGEIAWASLKRGRGGDGLDVPRPSFPGEIAWASLKRCDSVVSDHSCDGSFPGEIAWASLKQGLGVSDFPTRSFFPGRNSLGLFEAFVPCVRGNLAQNIFPGRNSLGLFEA